MKHACRAIALAALLSPLAAADLYTSTVPPVPILFGQTAKKQVVVADSFVLRDLNVIVRLAHPAVGELALALRHPDGTSVILAQAEGGAQAGFVLTTFDDEATATLATGTAPFKGTYRPNSPLSALDGKDAAGTWTLEVVDGVHGNEGTLFGVSLAFDGATYVYGGADVYILQIGGFTSVPLGQAPPSFAIADVDVAIDLSHSWIGDVDYLSLRGPAGLTKVFGTLFGFGAGDGGMRLACFDDEGPTPVSQPAPFTGRWQTKFGAEVGTALGAFDGMDAHAHWTLLLDDADAFGDDGFVHGWALHVTSSDTCLGVPATATAYGAGTAGTLGVPSLGASALPAIGTSFTIDVGSALGSPTPGALLVGASATSLPLLGGTLLVSAPTLLPLAVPAAGTSIPVTLAPSVASCGQRVYLQAAELDPGAPAGVAFSAGLELVIGS